MRYRSIALLTAAALAALAPSHAGGAPAEIDRNRVTVWLVGANGEATAAESAKLTFKGRGRGFRTARLNLLIENQAPVNGELEVAFLRPKWNPNQPLRPTQRVTDPTKLQLLWRAKTGQDGQPDKRIGAQDATPLVLVFRLPANAPAAAATGTLLIGLANRPRVASFLLPIAPAAQAPAALRVSQPKASILVTRTCGPLMQVSRTLREWSACSKGEDLQVDATGPVPPLTTTRLGSDRGKSLELSLRGGNQPRLEARNVGGAGTYSGQLSLNPAAEKPTSIETTVKVRDAIIWPLIALAAGIGVAYWLQWLQTVHRGRRVLRRRVTAAVNPYLERRDPDRPPRADEEERPGIYRLDLLLRPLSQEQFPKKGCSAGDLRVARLCCNIESAKTTDRLAELEKQVAALEAEFRRALDVLAAFDELSKAASRLRSRRPIKRDAELLLDTAADDYASDDEAAKIARAIRQQALITLLFRAISPMWHAQPRRWRLTHQWLKADSLYGQTQGAAAPTPEEQAAGRRRLTFALRQLHNPQNAAQDPGPFADPAVFTIMNFAAFTASDETWQSVDDALDQGAPLPSAQTLVREIRARDADEPERLERDIQRLDGLLFLGSAIVASLAYLLTKYSDSFGTLDDYLAAFAAGAAGTAGINLLLAPFARNRSSLEAPAAK